MLFDTAIYNKTHRQCEQDACTEKKARDPSANKAIRVRRVYLEIRNQFFFVCLQQKRWNLFDKVDEEWLVPLITCYCCLYLWLAMRNTFGFEGPRSWRDIQSALRRAVCLNSERARSLVNGSGRRKPETFTKPFADCFTVQPRSSDLERSRKLTSRFNFNWN